MSSQKLSWNIEAEFLFRTSNILKTRVTTLKRMLAIAIDH
jgi:hypothetical protein